MASKKQKKKQVANLQDNLDEQLNAEDQENIENFKKNEYDMNEELEHIPEAYKYLEYISVEYPSQTICEFNGGLLIGQCNGSKSSMVNLKFPHLEKNAEFHHRKQNVPEEINRIRHNNNFIATVSDNGLRLYNSSFEKSTEIVEKISYGLDLNENEVFCGKPSGEVMIYDPVKGKTESINVHTAGIDGLKVADSLLFTVSDDKTLKITDLRSNQQVNQINHDAGINTVDFISNSLVFGDESGLVNFCDMRNLEDIEKISWHKSPVNSVKFANENVFASVSDEQICLFDTTLLAEQDWDAHHWLYFVHRGQQYYKEICTIDDKWAVTSVEGLAIFQPTDEIFEEIDQV